MKKLLLSIFLPILLFTSVSYGQSVSLTTAGTAVVQDFNSLVNTANSSVLPNGWYLSETGTGANLLYTAGTGSSATGDTYSFGTTGSTSRSLGGLLSGAVIPSYGVQVTNNTGAPIDEIAISYKGQTWRVGAVNRADRLDFQYSIDATSLSTGTWVQQDNMDYANPGQAVLGNGVVQHTSTISGSITGLNIASGATIWIKFTDFNAPGSDDGMAIDDFSIMAVISTDTAAPIINAFLPADNAVNVGISTNPTLTFSENIVKGTGNLTIRNIDNSTSQVIAITSSDVVFNANTLTINNLTLLNSKSYAIQIDASAVKDEAGNFFAGITDETIWNFSTASAEDITPPTVLSLAPINGSINIQLSVSPSISFSENIQKGAGNIGIHNLTTGTSQVIDVTSTSIGINNNILTINGIVFENNSSYAIQISAGAIQDPASNPNNFSGISDNTSWAFSFNANPNAVNDVFSLYNDSPFNGSLSANDTDPNALVLSYAKLTDPANGTLVLNTNGTFSYNPQAGILGNQSFSYRVTNTDNYSSDAVVTFSITERAKVIISQYYEGTGTNKWIELTNPSGIDINTASAQLQLALYGISGDAGLISNFTSSTAPSQKVNLNVIIPAYGSVLIGNSSNGTDIPYLTSASANQLSSSVVNFNGNDGVALLDASNTIVDAFGQGINAKDASYVRNPGVNVGSSTFISSDWTRQTIVTVQNAVDSDDPDRLGVHIAPNLPECVSPAIAATNLNFNAANFTSISGTFTAAAGTSDYLVIRSTEPVFNGIPVDGVVYTAGSVLGNGIVVSSATGSTFTAAGLANGTTYYMTVFSYNATGCVGGPLYYTANYLAGSSTTTTPEPCVVPASQPTNFNITSSSYNYIQGSFTETIADEYLVVMSTSNTLSSNPINGNVYVVGESLGGGTVIKRGTGHTFLKTGLSGGTVYYFSVFAVNSDCGGGPVYQTQTPLKGNTSTSISNTGNLNFYYGNLHAHSSSSDGNKDDLTKTPADNFAFAKTALFMDFLGISEHNHTGAGMDLADWQPGVNAARASTSSTFVGMYGMEWGTISGGGHVLVYGIDSLIGWEPNQNQIYVPKSVYTGSNGLFRIVNRHGNNAIGMLAHPNTTDYNNLLSTYDADADLAIVGSAVESGPAFSTNVTYSDPGSSMSYLDYFNKMLSKGYHIGPSIDHDNHNYTFGKTAKSRLVVLAPSLSESELLNSLKQMRFYATEDYGAQITFTINNQPLGSLMTAAYAPNISVSSITTTAVSSIKIFYGLPGSGIAPVELTSSASGTLTYTDNNLANLSTGYYYADIVEIDGTRTITSPIWYTRDDTALPPKANQNITFGAITPKVYGDGDFDPAASSNNSATGITYSSSDINVASIVNNQVHIVSAGTVSITANQSGNNVFNDAAPQSQIFSISAKPITVTAEALIKVYGEADAALSFTASAALVNGDSFSGSLSRVAGENTGTYAINQGDLALTSNYVVSFQPSALTITAKEITVTADAFTKVYGEADAALSFTASTALVNGDSFSGSLSRVAGENTGIYAINQGDLALTSNYVVSFQPSALTITAKEITVMADALTKVYGEADAALSFTASTPLVNGDSFSGSLSRVAGENTGIYAINQGDLALTNNYVLSFQPSALTITAKAIILTAQAKTKVYGDTDPLLTYTSSETLIAGDAFTGSLQRALGERTGTYAISQGDLSLSNNYVLSFQPSVFTIMAKAITITAEAKMKVYGAADPALTYTSSETLISGDSFTGVLARVSGESTSTYNVTQGDLSLSNNYVLSFRSSVFTITAKAIMLSAEAKTKVYGDADPVLTYITSETLPAGSITGALSRTVGENAGTYTINQGDLSVSGNYSFSFQPSALTITAKALTIAADDKTRVEGIENPALTLTYTGFVNGETAGVLSTPTLVKTTATSTSPAGTYPIEVSGATSNNYAITYRNGTLAVNSIVSGAPTSVSLASVPVFENRPSGTDAGILSSTSDDPNATFTYVLVNGPGDTDNSLFSINGNKLATSSSLNFEQKINYSIRVSSTTQHGFSLEKVMNIGLNDVNEIPTLAAIANQVICYTVGTQQITLGGISAGPEGSLQNVVLTASSSNTNLFDQLSVSNDGKLSYKVKNGMSGTSTITVRVQDNGGTANGGTDSYSRIFTVTINPLPLVNITSDNGNSISKGETIRLTATGGSTYNWNNADGLISGQSSATITIRPSVTATYRVTVTTASGCVSEQVISIEVKEDYKLVKGTNILTPNGDGVNDQFVIRNIDMYPNNMVKIFNRAGRMVYSKSHYLNEWDGTFQGAPLTEETYYYIIDFGTGKMPMKGFITIVRD